MTATGIPPRAHGDIVRKARDLMAAHQATRDILLDRAEPPPLRLVARKRKLFDVFRKTPDPFAVTPARFDAWAAEIEACHPSRLDMWRDTSEGGQSDPRRLDLPDVAVAATKPDHG